MQKINSEKNCLQGYHVSEKTDISLWWNSKTKKAKICDNQEIIYRFSYMTTGFSCIPFRDDTAVSRVHCCYQRKIKLPLKTMVLAAF